MAQLANGDTFGEDSLLSGAPRNVTITALTDIVLLRLDKKQFVSLIKEPSLKFIDYAGMQDAVKQGTVLLDVRSQDDYEVHHIDGSINAPFFSLRMQLKTLSHDKPVIVICRDGKVSEAAAFLLLRNKIGAMILKGGMESIVPQQKVETVAVAENEVPILAQSHEYELVPVVQQQAEANLPEALDAQITALKLDNDALRNNNQLLNEKCMKLEFDKQHAEKQCRILQKQLEKLTQVLDKLKGN